MLRGKVRLTTIHGSGCQFLAESGTGHAFVMDDAEGHTAPKPIEFALLALGVLARRFLGPQSSVVLSGIRLTLDFGAPEAYPSRPRG